MTGLEYLDYLIATKNSEGEHHSLPIQASELQTLRAILRAEAMLRAQLEKELYGHPNTPTA